MKYVAKEIPEGINVTPHHPLVNFAYLLGTVVIASVLIFVTLGFIAEWLTTRISPETEHKIGQMLLHVIEDEEIQDDRRIEYLEELLYSLPKSGETIRLPLTIHLLESDVVNAAIMVGGHVLIHTALLETVKSENELALVLAHELGHFQARDPLKSLGRSLVFVAISAIMGLSEGGLPQIVPLTSQLTNLSYSRKQERAADIYGLSRVVSRYGHGGHSLDFFKRLETEQGQGKLLKVSEYFSTHPLSGARVDDLNQKAAEKGWSMEGDATPLPNWLRKND